MRTTFLVASRGTWVNTRLPPGTFLELMVILWVCLQRITHPSPRFTPFRRVTILALRIVPFSFLRLILCRHLLGTKKVVSKGCFPQLFRDIYFSPLLSLISIRVPLVIVPLYFAISSLRGFAPLLTSLREDLKRKPREDIESSKGSSSPSLDQRNSTPWRNWTFALSVKGTCLHHWTNGAVKRPL